MGYLSNFLLALKDLGVTQFVIGLLIGLMRPIWTLLLRGLIGPKISVEFDQAGSVILTPMRWDGGANDVHARFIRLKVANTGWRVVRNCAARLTKIETVELGKISPTIYVDQLPLTWSYDPDHSSIDIPAGTHRFVDVLIAIGRYNVKSFRIACPFDPLRYREDFFHAGDTYRLTVLVTADDAKSRTYVVRARWLWSWEDATAWPDNAPEPKIDSAAEKPNIIRSERGAQNVVK